MHQIDNYDVYIFDCDGVILNSNQLKIDAMKLALESSINDNEKVTKCVDYFRSNFGRSRFHHIDVFIEQFLSLDKKTEVNIRECILNAYSIQCKSLYLKAELTPGFIAFISQLKGKKYIASGSEENELRYIFNIRGLDVYFDKIYGSPTKKTDLVSNILRLTSTNNAVMFGDAISDLEASKINKIDFVGYLPFSNIKAELMSAANEYNSKVINEWSELL